jgi:hypothetical protein
MTTHLPEVHKGWYWTTLVVLPVMANGPIAAIWWFDGMPDSPKAAVGFVMFGLITLGVLSLVINIYTVRFAEEGMLGGLFYRSRELKWTDIDTVTSNGALLTVYAGKKSIVVCPSIYRDPQAVGRLLNLKLPWLAKTAVNWSSKMGAFIARR